MIEKLRAWLSDEYSGMESFLQTEERPDATIEEVQQGEYEWISSFRQDPRIAKAIQAKQDRYRVLYRLVAVCSCIVFLLVLLYVVAHLPAFGEADPQDAAIAKRYIERGLEETGATNIVAGMILDYRAFDTLGESFVLFTALLCSTMLLRMGKKNLRTDREDYYTMQTDPFFDTSEDSILRKIGFYLVPCILIFGIYIIFNGHLSPGGGFSGGAILGAALVILSSALGFTTADRILTYKRLNILSFAALAFYSLSKCYVFFTGANGIHNGIPKGTPGNIFSAGLILPLNIAVGLVVACTMYGFYSLFRRGKIGDA